MYDISYHCVLTVVKTLLKAGVGTYMRCEKYEMQFRLGTSLVCSCSDIICVTGLIQSYCAAVAKDTTKSGAGAGTRGAYCIKYSASLPRACTSSEGSAEESNAGAHTRCVHYIYKPVQARTLAESSARASGADTHTRCVLYEKWRRPDRDVRAGRADRGLSYKAGTTWGVRETRTIAQPKL
jgi:hypothetical protein